MSIKDRPYQPVERDLMGMQLRGIAPRRLACSAPGSLWMVLSLVVCAALCSGCSEMLGEWALKRQAEPIVDLLSEATEIGGCVTVRYAWENHEAGQIVVVDCMRAADPDFEDMVFYLESGEVCGLNQAALDVMREPLACELDIDYQQAHAIVWPDEDL